MKKLTGNINVGVFISGRGSNLKELIKYSKKNNTIWKIKLVISNKKKAKGLAYAKKLIAYAKLPLKGCPNMLLRNG